VVLLDEVIEVLVRPHRDVAPARVLAPQQPQRTPARDVAVKRHLTRHARERRVERFTEERLCGRDAAIAAEKEVNGLAMLIDCPVQIVPLRLDRDVRLIDAPRRADGSGKTASSLLELGHVPGNPSQDRRVGDLDAALGHHLHEVAIRQPIGDVPAHAELDYVGVEGPLAVDRVTGDRLRHPPPLNIRSLQSTECPPLHQNRLKPIASKLQRNHEDP
jgi:hypothetical protein